MQKLEFMNRGKQHKQQRDEIYTLCQEYDPPLTQQHIVETARAFGKHVKNPYFLQPINENYQELSDHLTGINVLYGASGSGRKSAIRWATRAASNPIVNIDCHIHSTEHQFTQYLVIEVCRALQQTEISKELIASHGFSSLNSILSKRKRNISVVVNHCQKLTEIKRQTIMYNLFEWVKANMEYVGLFMLTSDVKFQEKQQKRVKSRLTARNFYFGMINPESLINLLVRRLDAGCSHMGLFLVLRDILSSETVFKTIQQKILLRGIVNFLTATQQVICLLTVKEVSKYWEDRNELILKWASRMDTALSRISSSTCLAITKDLNILSMVVLAVIMILVKYEEKQLNFTVVCRKFYEVKAMRLQSQGYGSVYEYSKEHLLRGFKMLLDARLIIAQDDLAAQQVSVCLVHNYRELQMALLECKNKLPLFVVSLLEC